MLYSVELQKHCYKFYTLCPKTKVTKTAYLSCVSCGNVTPFMRKYSSIQTTMLIKEIKKLWTCTGPW
jgi:hypothetical protein